jgi:hypothetical protein
MTAPAGFVIYRLAISCSHLPSSEKRRDNSSHKHDSFHLMLHVVVDQLSAFSANAAWWQRLYLEQRLEHAREDGLFVTLCEKTRQKKAPLCLLTHRIARAARVVSVFH